MAGVEELAREYGGARGESLDHLKRLVRSWGLLADLSFSDLLLLGPAPVLGPDRFVVLGHVRPTTAQTIYREDIVGDLFEAADVPVASAAFARGRIEHGEVRKPYQSQPVHVVAVPVRANGEVIAVLTREMLPPLTRPFSELERTYNTVFSRLARMIDAGAYPFSRDEDDQMRAPRVGDGVVVLDPRRRVDYNSPNAVSALHRLGVHDSAEGHRLSDIGIDDHFVRQAFATQAPVFSELQRGLQVTVVLHCIPLLEQGRVSGALLLVRDISELRRRDRLLLSKDATIREIHHRVKNNLQTISSLLRMQSRRLESPEARAALEESVRRIASIAVVHETLAQQVGDESPFSDVIRPLVRMLEDGLTSPDRPVRFRIAGDAGSLPATVTTPLAVVLTELLQNAVEHGYRANSGDGTAEVVIVLGRVGDVLEVQVIDDGVGVPEGFSVRDSDGLGFTIVRTFVENDLGGDIAIGGRDDGLSGTQVFLRIPVIYPEG